MAIEMVFRWRADDGQNLHAGLVALRLFRGIRTINYKEPYIFVIVQGMESGPLSPFMDPRMNYTSILQENINTKCISVILLLSYISILVVG